MKKEDFWNLIDETNQLCPTHDQESIMAVSVGSMVCSTATAAAPAGTKNTIPGQE